MKFPIAAISQLFLAQSQTPITTMEGLKRALGSGIGLLVIFAYVAALVIFISGVMKKNSDPTGAADAIKTAAWLAGGTTIVSILFVVFGHTGAVVDANYNCKATESIIRLRSGETGVMGGFVFTQEAAEKRGIPFAERLPLVGRAFRTDTNATRRTELAILITATLDDL